MYDKYDTAREQKKEEITSMILSGIQHSKLTLINEITAELKKANTDKKVIEEIVETINEDAAKKIKSTPKIVEELFKKSDIEIEKIFNEVSQQIAQ
jgi:ribosomal protein L17